MTTIYEQQPEIIDINFVLSNKHLFAQKKKDDLTEEAEELKKKGVSQEKIDEAMRFLKGEE